MPPRKPKTTGRHRSKPDPLARRVGERIRRLRKERDLDWDAWVEEAQLGRGTLSEIERGLIAPGLHALAKMAKALDLTVADLVIGDSPREEIFVLTRDMDAEAIAELRTLARRLARSTLKP